MERKDIFTKILAVGGTVLVWVPILAPCLFSLIAIVRSRVFRFDYLMPAELFSATIVGGILLVWAAIRGRSRLKPISWSLGTAVGTLVAGQAIAVVSGLASGEAEPRGFWWIVVIGSILIYSLSVISLGINGVLFVRDALKTSPQSEP